MCTIGAGHSAATSASGDAGSGHLLKVKGAPDGHHVVCEAAMVLGAPLQRSWLEPTARDSLLPASDVVHLAGQCHLKWQGSKVHSSTAGWEATEALFETASLKLLQYLLPTRSQQSSLHPYHQQGLLPQTPLDQASHF